MNTEITKFDIKKVVKIFCPKCGELMIKFYPWSTIYWAEKMTVPECGKCLNKRVRTLKSGVA